LLPAQHHDDSAGHVFAAMAADALDHGDDSGVAHGEAFAGNAAEIAFAADCPIEHRIADDDAVMAHQFALPRRVDDDPAARQPLADIVVALTFQFQRHAARQESAEALSGGTGEIHMHRIVGQAGVAVPLGDLSGQHRADGAVDVADRQVDRHRQQLVQRRSRQGDKSMIQRLFQVVVLGLGLIERGAGGGLGFVQDPRQVDAADLGIVALPLQQSVALADHLVETPEPEPGHQLTHFRCDEQEEIGHILGLADEAVAQFGVLGRDADRAGVEVALAHHDAAGRDQGGGGEAELVRAQQRPDDHVAAGAHTAVDLDGDAVA